MKLNLQLFAVDLNTIAREVLAGKWGNGADRKKRLTEAGYNYSEVQSLVNSLSSNSSSKPKTTTSNSTNSNPKPGAFTYDPYQESDAIRRARELLEQQMAQKPGEYQSNWQQQINDTLERILNREDFAYDLNGDALYQQYKDQYALQGQQAMMDVMGQAAAMNGGYGNSYAQTVGQQTYQGYLQQLNDKVPELYQLALNQYNQEGQDLYNQYGLYVDRENQDYSRYRDTVGGYNTELERLINDARYLSETEYQRWLDEYNMKYGQHRDNVDDYWTQRNFDEAVRQYNASQSSSRNSTRTTYEDKDEDEDDDPKPAPEPDYSSWDEGDWEGYFAQIRQSEGRAAAEEELRHFTSNGLIPTKYVNAAAIGVRGGSMGH